MGGQGTEEFICHLCEPNINLQTSYSELRSHVLDSHSHEIGRSRILSCEVCLFGAHSGLGKSKYTSTILRHNSDHRDGKVKMECPAPQCGGQLVMDTWEAYRGHLRGHSDDNGIFTCPSCPDFNSQNVSTWINHVSGHSKSFCATCKIQFTNPKALKIHGRKFHLDEDMLDLNQSQEQFICHLCEPKIDFETDKTKLTAHIMDSHRNLDSPSARSRGRIFICPLCYFGCSLASIGGQHNCLYKMLDHNKEHGIGKVKMECGECGPLEGVTTWEEYRKHIHETHLGNGGKGTCDKCPASYLRSSHRPCSYQSEDLSPYIVHVTNHLNSFCSLCKLSFDSTEALQAHVPNNHDVELDSRQNEFICHLCEPGINFERNGNEFTIHILKTHVQPRGYRIDGSFTCAVCLYGCTMRSGRSKCISKMLEHNLDHGNGKVNMECPQCGPLEEVTKWDEYRQHLLTTHSVNGTFTCDKCPAEAFNSEYASTWINHVTEHTRSYCTQCNLQFRKPYELLAHIQKDHFIPTRVQKLGPGTLEYSTLTSKYSREGIIPFSNRIRCPLCPKKRLKYCDSNYRTHMHRIHDIIVPFSCRNCSNIFPSRQALTRHQKNSSLNNSSGRCVLTRSSQKQRRNVIPKPTATKIIFTKPKPKVVETIQPRPDVNLVLLNANYEFPTIKEEGIEVYDPLQLPEVNINEVKNEDGVFEW